MALLLKEILCKKKAAPIFQTYFIAVTRVIDPLPEAYSYLITRHVN